MKEPTKGLILKSYPDGHVTQFFGENPQLYGAAYMKNPMRGHNGIDIVAAHGTPIFAVESGEVVSVFKEQGGYGNHIRIHSAGGREWTYGHLSRMDVKVGKLVKEGDQIGLMGNTGFVVSGATPYWKHNPYAGTHLHLGLRLFHPDPRGFAYAGSTSKVTIDNYGNGFFGSIDPLPYLQNIAPKDPVATMPPVFEPKAPTATQLTILSLCRQVLGLLQELIKLRRLKT